MKKNIVTFSQIVFGAFILTFLVMGADRLRAIEVPKEVNLSVPQIEMEVKSLQESWSEEKKEYKKELEELIRKIEDATRERENMLDRGDLELRKRINEERRDLERERDKVKRKLAEISAADTIDLFKIKEEIDAKIQDLQD